MKKYFFQILKDKRGVCKRVISNLKKINKNNLDYEKIFYDFFNFKTVLYS